MGLSLLWLLESACASSPLISFSVSTLARSLSPPFRPLEQAELIHYLVEQAEVFSSAASSLVSDVMNGLNGTLLVFGQTGSGKVRALHGIHSWHRFPAADGSV